MKSSQIAWLVGLVTCISTAMISENSLSQYHKYISMVSVIGTAISGYMLEHPWNGKERRKHNLIEANLRYQREFKHQRESHRRITRGPQV